MKLLPALFLTIIIVVNTCYSQSNCKYKASVPDELYRGRYKPANANYGNPYTMFNKRKSNWNLEAELVEIRNNIVQQINSLGKAYGYAEMYKEIYQDASSEEPAACNYDQEICLYPGWVKNNAIVFLIGIKYELTSTGADKFEYISDPFNTERYSFAEHAANGLRNLNPNIQTCFGGGDCGILKNKALDLINYLQAYDALKTAKYYREGDGDRNGGDCSGRNKLREYTRNFYIESEDVINSFTGWKRNHGIMCASALGMAAIVLNDAGVETDWLSFGLSVLNPFMWIANGVHIPRPNYSPKNWQKRGDGNGGYDWGDGEDGIEDCMFTGKHMIGFEDVPQTNSTGTSGYAEGPDYATYMLNALGPYMRASANFRSPSDGKYLDDPRYNEILKWYINITKQNGTMPTYDNSAGSPNILGILGMNEWPGNAAPASEGVDLRGDFILAMGGGTLQDSKYYDSSVYINNESGNAILRTNTPKGNYYFQFLSEHGTAVDKPVNMTELSHEDTDFGSFHLSVNETWLAIDPPYLSSPFQIHTNEFTHHNYACFSSNVPIFTDPVAKHTANSDLKLSFNQLVPSVGTGTIIRNVKMFNTAGFTYYILNDHFDGNIGEARIAINGNGNLDESTFFRSLNTTTKTYNSNGRVFRWEHPCLYAEAPSTNWSLLSHITQTNTGTTTITEKSTNTHGNPGNIASGITVSKGIKDMNDLLYTGGITKYSLPYGEHTRIEVLQEADNTIIQTLLFPYLCNDTTLPLIDKIEASTYVSTILHFLTPIDTTVEIPGKGRTAPAFVNDTTTDFHVSRLTSGTLTITNPFSIAGNSDNLETNADDVFMSRSKFTLLRIGACTKSFITFKQGEIDNGTYLKYDDTTYIEAAMPAKVHYEYAGKFRYKGYVHSSSGTSVRFFLPDLQPHFRMQAKEGDLNLLTFHDYDSLGGDSFKYVTAVFTSGTTYFTLELADPCAADCYFPPTAITIDSTFLFETGKKESLGHDLDIVQGEGNLTISNMSRMSICPDFVLVNKDSIVMKMDCTPEKRWIVNEDGSKVLLPLDTLKYLCNRDALFADRAVNETRNTIIVNNKAGLVLDSGSVTHIGLNSTILIRSGGTLLVKRGATVIVGDSDCIQNRGELLADHGAYVCIEEGAVMKFYNDIDSFNFYYKDTLDRHLVYIAMPKGSGKPGAIAGVNTLGGRGKFDITRAGIWSTSNCIPFCDLKDKNPPHGINNRPFGWCNIGLPRAHFTSADTLCIGKPFSIDATHSLNETGYTITVCKYDTGSHLCITSVDSISDNGDNCLSNRYLFTPTETGYYRVRLIVRNDCNQTDTFTKIVYVPHLPVAAISISGDSICPGIGSLYANGFLSRSNIAKCKHRWTIEPIMEDSMDENTLYGLDGNRDWLIDSLTAVDSSFNFPGYHFTGGIRYLVSLTVWGWCSDSTVWDTVLVHRLRASITKDSLKVYPDVSGYTHATITIFGSGYNGLLWSPTTNLDTSDSLHPIASPLADTKYYLTAEDNYGCTVYDSVVVRSIYCAKAGFDKTICIGDSVNIGIEPPPPCDPWTSICTVSNCFGGFLWVPADGLDNPNVMYPKASPSVTTQYTLYLINTEVIWEEGMPPSIIEFDQVTVYVDSTLYPSIEVIYQTDSTLYFTPSHIPLPAEYTYLWTFGDGDSSTLMNPGHTFPAFDSVYRVCLAVTNACGTYTYCDSIHVDSSGLSENGIGKRSLEDAQNSVINMPDKPTLKNIKNEVLLDNIPNPFTESTSISYAIGKEYRSAELRITDILGRIVKVYALSNIKGQVTFDGSPYKGSLYYSSLIVDGIVVKSKTMVIER